jgi:hypothetical protein
LAVSPIFFLRGIHNLAQNFPDSDVNLCNSTTNKRSHLPNCKSTFSWVEKVCVELYFPGISTLRYAAEGESFVIHVRNVVYVVKKHVNTYWSFLLLYPFVVIKMVFKLFDYFLHQVFLYGYNLVKFSFWQYEYITR